MFLELCISVLFISLMESVNGVKVSNTTSLMLLFGFAAGGGTSKTDIVPLYIYIYYQQLYYRLNHQLLPLIFEMFNCIFCTFFYLDQKVFLFLTAFFSKILPIFLHTDKNSEHFTNIQPLSLIE